MVNWLAPSKSMLLLAPEPAADSRGLVTIAELRQQRFDSVEVVVLSACSTGNAMVSKSEGAMSLANAFLSQGVPYVVATLVPVEDQATADLMVRFHAALSAGIGPAKALRMAQAQVIHAPARSWAAMELFLGRGSIVTESPEVSDRQER